MRVVVICSSSDNADKVRATGMQVGYTGIKKPLWLMDYKNLFFLDNGLFEYQVSVNSYNDYLNIEYIFSKHIHNAEEFKLTYKTPEWLSNNLSGKAQIIYQVGSHTGLISVPRDATLGVCPDVYKDRTWADFNGRNVWIYAKNVNDLWNTYTELRWMNANILGVVIGDSAMLHTHGMRSDCIADTKWVMKTDNVIFRNNLITYATFWEKVKYIEQRK